MIDKNGKLCYTWTSANKYSNWSMESGGGIECLFVQKINLQSQEEIKEEQTGKCLHLIW